MRCFIAINLSKEAEEELERVRDLVIDKSVKASKTKEFHLTLKFLGDVEEKKISKIAEELKKVKVGLYKLKLSKLGVFPDKNYIRVVWIGLDDNNELTSLHKNIQDLLKPFNFKDDHDFKPHLTIARVKYISDKQDFIQKIEQVKVKQVEFESKSFVLYKSTLTPQGPVYEKVEEFF